LPAARAPQTFNRQDNYRSRASPVNCSRWLGARLPRLNHWLLARNYIDHFIARLNAVVLCSPNDVAVPAMIGVDVIEILGTREDLQYTFVIAFLVVIPRCIRFINDLPRNGLRKPHRHQTAVLSRLDRSAISEKLLHRRIRIGTRVINLTDKHLGEDQSKLVLIQHGVKLPHPRFIENRLQRAPNVNRLSCRPPAEEGYQPTTTFYSRASPVNCSRWLAALREDHRHQDYRQ